MSFSMRAPRTRVSISVRSISGRSMNLSGVVILIHGNSGAWEQTKKLNHRGHSGVRRIEGKIPISRANDAREMGHPWIENRDSRFLTELSARFGMTRGWDGGLEQRG